MLNYTPLSDRQYLIVLGSKLEKQKHRLHCLEHFKRPTAKAIAGIKQTQDAIKELQNKQ